ncbi:MAG: SDR family oxidoreductase [Phycisphaerales bacterium]|nr:SDR family oxidoreductase [Phycisphaerales bacterium]
MDTPHPLPNLPTDLPADSTIVVTGPTGYVGGRLVPILLDEGYKVRCIARAPRKLDDREWRSIDRVSVEQSDLSDIDTLTQILQGATAAYYLIHSMEATGEDYAARDRQLASNFAQAAKAAGVERIIYLGGLGEADSLLSEHLSSRREVEEILGSTGVPVTVFRAAMIIGSGSVSFEILRYLVERLPIMITPSWVMTESQPVAIADVLHWLVRALQTPDTAGKVLEIGGADIFSYNKLMKIMAQELKLPKRIIIPVPVLTPRLSSGWISLITPVSYRIARPLADGLRNKVVVTNNLTQELMPHNAMGVREAISKALARTESGDIQTRWSVAGPIPGDPDWAGGTTFTDERTITIDAPPNHVFKAICRIGGGHGWYAADILWKLRGWMDTLVGGPGLRRGRRDQERVEFGETLDFWRVIGIEHDKSLTLRAEMKLPGVAILDFNIKPSESPNHPSTQTHMTMTARFRPKGILGILYWYSVYPFHGIVFKGMLKGIKRSAESQCCEPKE